MSDAHNSGDVPAEQPSALGRDIPADEELTRIVDEEQRVLARVQKHLANRPLRRTGRIDYDSELVALRDQIAEARLEDVPALVAQMERLQQVAARRADVTVGEVDAGSPYFGRLVLLEGNRKREVLIGRATYLDPRTGVQIVDWRDAPVSRVYYRYEEGDDYDEVFGDRMVEGEVLTRRSLAIAEGTLRRIGSPQGTFLRRLDGQWVRAGQSATQLKGGQGSAPRPSHYKPVGKLGVDTNGQVREDKHLPEIAALIDARQFDLITRPDSGLVVIQGGAGSGKTTIGLHRLAYLAYQQPKRFRPDQMLVVVFNDALARYISHVLPALGVQGVPVTTYHSWARKLRTQHLSDLPRDYTDDTPDTVIRLKKHPAWLRIIDEHVQKLSDGFVEKLRTSLAGVEGGERAIELWHQSEGRALRERLQRLSHWASDAEQPVAIGLRHAIERETAELERRTDVIALWAELLTDREGLTAAFAKHAPGEWTDGQLGAAYRWCVQRCGDAIAAIEEENDEAEERAEAKERVRDHDVPESELGIDGLSEKKQAELDWEDDALLLRIHQRLRGPLARHKEALRYEHVFVDEAQDLSPLELAVVLDTVHGESVTLAGDVAQRVMMDNGFSDWQSVLASLGFSHVAIEPLRISYRSTFEIMELANTVLGEIANTATPAQAPRHGVPVELFHFSHAGDAVGFLSEALRSLVQGEPLASVAVITRTPEQAVEYARGLTNAEVPNVRLIAEQDFPFRPGVDVTDVRQVKGLEFDYVVLVEVTAVSYPDNDESRHLLHIAATRAAHQLWITTSDRPSVILPAELRERGY
ncbi:MAG TPA: 3'-5' exonuclease [Polyangiales bacterium]|jgi:DNA helicase-2/ATP-dependent DNA helicase PcrA|nr:3'-5' exonuclease [Polyangiales bacterium]